MEDTVMLYHIKIYEYYTKYNKISMIFSLEPWDKANDDDDIKGECLGVDTYILPEGYIVQNNSICDVLGNPVTLFTFEDKPYVDGDFYTGFLELAFEHLD